MSFRTAEGRISQSALSSAPPPIQLCSLICTTRLVIRSVNATVPKELCWVFLIDVSRNSADTQMLYYAVLVMKEILAKEAMD